jgi:hypothetical protein
MLDRVPGQLVPAGQAGGRHPQDLGLAVVSCSVLLAAGATHEARLRYLARLRSAFGQLR